MTVVGTYAEVLQATRCQEQFTWRRKVEMGMQKRLAGQLSRVLCNTVP